MDLRIGVLGLFAPGRVVIAARRIAADGEVIAAPLAELEARPDGLALRAGSRRGRATRIAAAGDVRVTVPGRLERSYAGQLSVTSAGGSLRLAVILPLETAVASAVAAEAPHAPLEALKAQAIVARSYYTALHPRHGDLDFCDTTHCQFLRDSPAAAHPASQAAAQTRGLVILHHGHHFGPMFFRSCGGTTLTAGQVNLDASLYPYFAVACPGCKASPARWEARVERGEAARLPSENARVELGRKYGWNRIASNCFTSSDDASGGVILRGVGEGHGLGMCQRGAAFLARAGQGHGAILRHYFPETTIVLS